MRRSEVNDDHRSFVASSVFVLPTSDGTDRLFVDFDSNVDQRNGDLAEGEQDVRNHRPQARSQSS